MSKEGQSGGISRMNIVRLLMIGSTAVALTACEKQIQSVLPSETSTPISSPTAAPTRTAEATNTPTETPTIIPTETATATVEAGIDLVKLNNVPASNEVFLANPENYVGCPYDLVKEPQKAKVWLISYLVPALGGIKDRQENFKAGGLGSFGDTLTSIPVGNSSPLINGGKFFYVEVLGTKYPVLVINVSYTSSSQTIRTMAVILYHGHGSPQGPEALDSISDGKEIRIIDIFETPNSIYPDEINKVIEAGFNGEIGDNFIFGPGRINTAK
jgi:hypothetical protein